MSFSLNKVMLIGHVGQSPETRFTNSNKKITNISLATNESYKSGDEWKTNTTWHKIVVWNAPDKLVEAIKKGSKLYVEGRIQYSEVEDENGGKKKYTNIVSQKLILLDARNNGSHSAEEYESEPEKEDLPF